MEYVEPAIARTMPGLRLALTAHVPGPWGESAKSIFKFKGLDYVPVKQVAGAPNEDLVAWTGVRNAPNAIWEDSPGRTNHHDILMLAERLAPEPRLLPDDIEERMLCSAISMEICGEGGWGWTRRLIMQRRRESMAPEKANASGIDRNTMLRAYGAPKEEVDAAPARACAILDKLAARLEAQKAKGSDYFVGSGVTACDIHWASFSGMLEPLPHEVNPMPPWMRDSYAAIGETLEKHKHPILLAHRDMMYERHLGLPLVY